MFSRLRLLASRRQACYRSSRQLAEMSSSDDVMLKRRVLSNRGTSSRLNKTAESIMTGLIAGVVIGSGYLFMQRQAQLPALESNEAAAQQELDDSVDHMENAYLDLTEAVRESMTGEARQQALKAVRRQFDRLNDADIAEKQQQTAADRPSSSNTAGAGNAIY